MTAADHLAGYRQWLQDHRDDTEVVALGQRLGRLLAGEAK